LYDWDGGDTWTHCTSKSWDANGWDCLAVTCDYTCLEMT
jgi:hypothetical protein